MCHRRWSTGGSQPWEHFGSETIGRRRATRRVDDIPPHKQRGRRRGSSQCLFATCFHPVLPNHQDACRTEHFVCSRRRPCLPHSFRSCSLPGDLPSPSFETDPLPEHHSSWRPPLWLLMPEPHPRRPRLPCKVAQWSKTYAPRYVCPPYPSLCHQPIARRRHTRRPNER